MVVAKLVWACDTHSGQTPCTDQQHYPSHSPRRNGRNRDRGPSSPPANVRHYPDKSSYGYGNHHGVPGGGDGGPPDNPYGTGLDSSYSSEFGIYYTHDQHTQQCDQFEQS